jgi:inositol transport system substrate-binding protein
MLAPLAVFGSGEKEGAGDVRIAFLFQDLETEFWVASHQAIVSTLEQEGVQVIQKNAHESANKQLEQTRDVIAQGVDGIIVIPQDGQSAVTIVGEANDAGIPIGIYNRPPADKSNPALVVVADNEKIATSANEYMAKKAREKMERTGEKIQPAILVGDLGDPNAVARRKGFYNVIDANPELFKEAIEIPSKWDSNTARANLESAFQANPDIDYLFTSSDFLIPQIKSVLAPRGKWQKVGHEDHVILGGLDGDKTACSMIEQGYMEATGVQDLYAEAEMMLDAMLSAIEEGKETPENWMNDPGFALTQGNWDERKMDMWGCKLYYEEQEGSE